MNEETYQTDDIAERNVTVALNSLFASIAEIGATEDPLSLVCKCLVHNIDDIQFAFYCYADDETGVIGAVRDGVKIYMPPPDVQRKIVANLRCQTRGEKVAVITPEKSLSLLSAAQRRRWKCHRCMAVEISVGGRPSAVLSVYLKPEFVITDRHRVWLKLFRGAASALLVWRALLEEARMERDASVKVQHEQTLAIEAARSRVRAHLSEISQVRNACRSGVLSLQDAVKSIEASARSLDSLSDVTERKGDASAVVFRDKALGEWVEAGLHDPRIKVIVGVRGSNKSPILHAVRSRVLASGVDESRVAIVDFENARFRRFKTADDVMDYLGAFPLSKKTCYLFMDEVGMIGWHAELLRRLQRDRRWNVWIAASTSRAIVPADAKRNSLNLLVYHTWTDPNVPRSYADLEKIWCQIFMRDVVSGIDHPDIRAKEALAEYYSDHLGEVKSLREVSKELAANGRAISTVSIRVYRQALVDANLIEFSKVYDVFERSVVAGLSGRAFYTDLELRTWRFGSAPTKDETRLALNRLYLDLRRKYDDVYTPRDSDADFVTLDAKGLPVLWRLPVDSLLSPESFRGGGVNFKKTTEFFDKR